MSRIIDQLPVCQGGLSPRASRFFENLAFVILLAILAARPFLLEMPFRTAPALAQAAWIQQSGSDSARQNLSGADLTELARVTLAAMILLAGVCYLASRALGERSKMRMGWLEILAGIFAAFTFASAMFASDKRSAMDSWLEQVSLLAAFLLATRLLADRRRLVLVLVTLTALAGAMATKGAWQWFVEAPDRIEQFHLYHDQQIQLANISPGTPEATAFENRINDRAVIGYFSLANLLASLMIILTAAAAGLAADKLIAARRDRRLWKGAKGEIHTPTLAAWFTVVLAAAGLATLCLTFSRGGIVSGILAIAAAVAIAVWRRSLAKRWKLLTAMAFAIFLAGVAATVAYGLANDRLPGKSMTFRWYYWTASAKIVEQHPLLGVGPGNFPDAYLQVRRMAAEESVKLPHNVIAQVMSEYGLPAGACFLAILTIVLVRAARPARLPSLEEVNGTVPIGNPHSAIRNPQSLAWLLVPLLAVPAARILLAGAGSDSILFAYDILLPEAAFAVVLVAAAWFGRRLLHGADLTDGLWRIFLGCGLAGFVLHNFVEFGLFAPGAAIAFWVAAGACLAIPSRPDVHRDEEADQQPADMNADLSASLWPARRNLGEAGSRLGRYVALAYGLAFMVIIVGWIWLPVTTKTFLISDAFAEIRAGRPALPAVEQAVQADPLDSLTASEASRLVMSQSSRQAVAYAKLATDRDPGSSANWRLLAQAQFFDAFPDAYRYQWRSLGGQNKELREKLLKQVQERPSPIAYSALAGMDYTAGRYDQAADWLRKAISLDMSSAMLYVHLGDTLHRAGNQPKAEKAWEYARALIVRKSGFDEDPFLTSMLTATTLNPYDTRLEIDYAQMLWWADSPIRQHILDAIRDARAIQNALPAESIERLSKSEEAELELLEVKPVTGILGLMYPDDLKDPDVPYPFP